MIFETLYESCERNELILIDGGLCHWHMRRDGQLTVREIIVIPELRRCGIGRGMLNILKAKAPKSIFAKCPVDLMEANKWYESQGFALETTETTKSGRTLNHWRLTL